MVNGPVQQAPPPEVQVPPSEAAQPQAVANPAIRAYPAHADGHGVKIGGYNKSRWAEDWRQMADPAKRDDPIDRLKFLPLDDSGDIYVTLSGEARFRTNYTGNPGLIDGDHEREDQLRLVAGADVHLGTYVRFYGELAHAGTGGHNIGTPSAKLQNDLIVQQAFGEVSAIVDSTAIGVRYGRQEFTDGSPLLLSQKDDSPIRTVLNGFRGWAMSSRLRFTLFDFEYTAFGREGLSDDKSDDSTRFSGVTMGIVLPSVAKGEVFLDPFFWRERHDAVSWGGVSEREERLYYGARLWGDIGRWTIDWTVDHQGGSFGNRDIDAWNLFIAQTYGLSDSGWKPELGIHFDYGSGGGSYDGGALKVASTPVGGSSSYSYQGLLTISNLFQVAPNITVTPVRDVKTTFEYIRAWRADENDAVYRSNSRPYAGTELLDGKDIGQSFRIQAAWKITQRLSVTGRYEYFDTGKLLTRLGYTDSHYLAAWTSFRF
ncbi:alginate export family protein [Stakelama sp. CBK3Z-3]|uniref:Alginate export family protein n=2 Tax=Stakelama flava TaxID=2860338 RepID=A0ABS6XJM7_9SPHN|nr:alginate export family protein [Stakelama flava]